MSTINQIQLPNGSTYDFEDTAAREEASSKADKTLATASANGLMSAADKKAIDREFFRMLPKGGTYIPANADLNSIEYLKVGNYYNSVSASAGTINNIPIKSAFMMYVLSPLSEEYDNESSSSWVYRLRIFVAHTGLIYTQLVSSGATKGVFSYGSWTKLATNKSDIGLANVSNYDQSKAIKSITRNGTTFTATALDGTQTTFTQQDTNTTYPVATTSTDGLMSAADKSKLDGIGAGSNVKSVNGKTGAVSLSKADVGLGNVDNTSDVDKPYYKLIGQTAANNKVGHFNFNDASRSLYKIKNFYAASGEGDYFYLAHKKSDYTITATQHFSNTADLFTADLSSDCDCRIATNLISESDPAILTIVRKDEIDTDKTVDDLTLIFYEDMGLQSNARLKHWKLETMIFTGQNWEWLTVFERTNVSDSINCLWCGLNPNDNWAYLRIKGIRITIYAATPCSTQSWAFGYNQLRIAGMRLLESRPLFSPAEALGALDVAGGTVYGETTFQEGISATSYSGATATSSADGLMSKDDKAMLYTLEERIASLWEKIYPVGSIYMSANPTNPAELFGGTWEQIKDRFLLAAGNTYAAGDSGGSASHSHTLSNDGAACIGNFSNTTAFSTGHKYFWKDYSTGTNMWAWTHNGDDQLTSSTVHYNDGSFVGLTGSTDSNNSMPPYLAVYMWKRTA